MSNKININSIKFAKKGEESTGQKVENAFPEDGFKKIDKLSRDVFMELWEVVQPRIVQEMVNDAYELESSDISMHFSDVAEIVIKKLSTLLGTEMFTPGQIMYTGLIIQSTHTYIFKKIESLQQGIGFYITMCRAMGMESDEAYDKTMRTVKSAISEIEETK